MPPDDHFPASEFDVWAETYDQSVSTDQFPFYGYETVLDKVVTQAKPRPGMSVLDLGTGTGNLAVRFNRLGCKLWCADFSQTMLAKARRKLPSAHFILYDLRDPRPADLNRRFERIVSAYVFHHFELEGKIHILLSLIPCLAPGGWIVIADIAFPDRAAWETVKQAAGDEWEEEYYWLADETRPALAKAGLRAEYVQVSTCAGVYTIQI